MTVDLSHHALFESAFHYAAIGKALVGLDGKWLKVNAALTEILGYSESELLSIDFQTLTHPDDLDADMEQVRAMINGSKLSYQMEKRYFHKSGSTIWGLLSVSMVRKPDGSPYFFISEIQDITARKQAEMERDAFFNESADMLAIADLTGHLLKVNRAWEDTLGWSQSELTSQPYIAFLHPDDVSSTDVEAKRIADGKSPKKWFCNRYRTAAGDYRWLEWHTTPFGERRLFCCVRDVTQRIEAEESLRQSEQRFQDMASNVPGVVYQMEWYPDAAPRFTYISPKSWDVLGVAPEEVLQDSKCLSVQLHPEDRDTYLAELDRCSQRLAYRYVECRFILRDGRSIWTSVSAMPRPLKNGAVLWTGLLQDITPRQLLKQKLIKSENMYRSLVSSLAEGVIFSAADDEILACNQSAQSILELSEDQIKNRSIVDPRWQFIRENGMPLPYDERPSYICLSTGKAIRNCILGTSTPNGGLKWLSISAEPLFAEGATTPYACVTSFFDITELKMLTAKLEQQARFDFLTGAYTRGHLYELASGEFARVKRYGSTFSLMLLDVDHFKSINDRYGHDGGDQALKQLVSTLSETLRDVDVIGRFGGEEFLILLPATDDERARIIAERVRESISEMKIILSEQVHFSITASIGLAQFSKSFSTIDQMIKAADTALYRAKDSGRNKVIYEP